MDLVCLRCGENWDLFHVMENKEEFKFAEENTGKIIECESCRGKKIELSEEENARLEAMGAIADLLGDDVDGLACMYEDLMDEDY